MLPVLDRTFKTKIRCLMGGSIAQWLAYLLPYIAALGLIPSIPKNVSEVNIIEVAEVNQWCWLVYSGQWLENVDKTHLVI